MWANKQYIFLVTCLLLVSAVISSEQGSAQNRTSHSSSAVVISKTSTKSKSLETKASPRSSERSLRKDSATSSLGEVNLKKDEPRGVSAEGNTNDHEGLQTNMALPESSLSLVNAGIQQLPDNATQDIVENLLNGFDRNQVIDRGGPVKPSMLPGLIIGEGTTQQYRQNQSQSTQEKVWASTSEQLQNQQGLLMLDSRQEFQNGHLQQGWTNDQSGQVPSDQVPLIENRQSQRPQFGENLQPREQSLKGQNHWPQEQNANGQDQQPQKQIINGENLLPQKHILNGQDLWPQEQPLNGQELLPQKQILNSQNLRPQELRLPEQPLNGRDQQLPEQPLNSQDQQLPEQPLNGRDQPLSELPLIGQNLHPQEQVLNGQNLRPLEQRPLNGQELRPQEQPLSGQDLRPQEQPLNGQDLRPQEQPMNGQELRPQEQSLNGPQEQISQFGRDQGPQYSQGQQGSLDSEKEPFFNQGQQQQIQYGEGELSQNVVSKRQFENKNEDVVYDDDDDDADVDVEGERGGYELDQQHRQPSSQETESFQERQELLSPRRGQDQEMSDSRRQQDYREEEEEEDKRQHFGANDRFYEAGVRGRDYGPALELDYSQGNLHESTPYHYQPTETTPEVSSPHDFGVTGTQEEDDDWYDDPNTYEEDKTYQYEDNNPEADRDAPESNIQIIENDAEWDRNGDVFQEDVVESDMIKKDKQPTAPSSMVLFYTWMVLAILIMVVSISTYQTRCKGLLAHSTVTIHSDDRARLLEHEFA